jgi:hypothetical protein
MIYLLRLLILLLPFSAQAQSLQTINLDCSTRVCFPKEVTVSQAKLPLIGTKLFRYYLWTAYSIALYAREPDASSERILEDVPKRLVLTYHMDFSAEDIISAGDKLLKSNPDIDLSKISSELEAINKLYVDIEDGDSYTLEYYPGQGTRLLLNDKELGTVAGADFAKAYFGIWLSAYSISMDMRDSLLGLS